MLYSSPLRKAIILSVCFFALLFALPNALPHEWREWMAKYYLPHQTVNLGLDLQGGSSLLLEVGVHKVVVERLNGVEDSVRKSLRENNIRYTGLRVGDEAVRVRISNADQIDQAQQLINSVAQPVGNALIGQTGKEYDITVLPDQQLEVKLTEVAKEDIRRRTVEQSIEVIRERIDALGTKEPTIQQQGADRVLVQVPGLQDPEQLKRVLGQTARMTFHLVDFSAAANQITPGREPPGSKLYAMKKEPGQKMLLRERAVLSGDRLKDARQSFDGQSGEPVVSFSFDLQGARIFAQVTTENVGRPFAIVLDNEIITAPNIRTPITGGQGQIEGGFTVETANELAIMLNAGSYPADIKVIEERTVGAELGADSIEAGKLACLVGLFAVCAFMIFIYGEFGIFATLALVVNIAIIFAVMSVMNATLTLPGIAGIVLTVGLAVDTNVLIYERTREELTAGKSALSAMEAGFTRAMATIIDTHLTNIVSVALLFIFGSGPVKGFGVTLIIGITSSLFTAVMVTRLIMATWYRLRRPKTLPI
jgi:protein-export membrane protein SecD